MAIQFFQTANFANTITATSFVKRGGTSSQYLMADGSVSTGSSSVAWADITNKPTTISGFGITDAFDGAYSSLTGTPTIPTDFVSKANGGTFSKNIHIDGTSGSNGNAFSVNRGEDGAAAFRVENSGEVVVGANYFYAAAGGTSMYVQNTAVFRGGILNDSAGAPVLINDSLKVQGTLSVTADGSNAVTFTESGNGLMTVATPDDFVVDAAGDISLDTAGNDIRFKKSGVEFGKFKSDSNNFSIYSSVQDKDMLFKGNDGGSTITALALDMSAGGDATFSGKIKSNSDLILQVDADDNTSGSAFKLLGGGGSTLFKIVENGNIDAHGVINFTGTATTTSVDRGLYWTGFDKEGTTDFTDNASITHTTNTGGHSGSVLEIKSMNDSGDGIAFTTHASSLLKHNGNAIFSEGHKPTWSEIDSKPSTFAPSAHNQAWSTITSTPTTISGYGITDAFSGSYADLTNVPSTFAPSSHNHDDRYYTETEIDAKFTSSNGTEDEFKFTLGDESNMSGNKWYKVATINQGAGGLHIKGSFSNHVESFGTQHVDLFLQGREGNNGDEIEITGRVDVLHNASSGTDKVGVRVIEADTSSSPHYHYYDVYMRTARYTQAKFHLTKWGLSSFHTSKPSVTSEPSPASGGSVELDTSSLLEGNYVIDDSVAKEIYHEGHKPTWSEIESKPSTFTPSSHNHAASEITSGTFATARIPNLAASKITSGTFATARIPDLSASKITSGTLNNDRLPNQVEFGQVSVNDDLFLDGENVLSEATGWKRYEGSVTGVSNSAYKTAFTVNGGNLASNIRFSVQGTTSSVVVCNLIDLSVNHHQDIMIEALSGVYTQLSVKVVSNNNEDFAVELKTNSANAVTLYIEIIAYGSESATFTNSHSYSGTTLTATLPAGKYIKGTGGDSGDLEIGGVFRGDGSGLTSISYNDLDNKPTIPSGNYYLDGITKSGNTLTFSVNGATNQTYTFGSNAFNSTTIPTNNNQLTNGSGYITSSGVAAKIKAGGTGPSTENLNTVANSVSTGQLEYRGFNSSSSNKPATSDNANGVITVGQHSGNYSAQLAFSSNGNIYWRDNPNGSHGSWRKMWDEGNDGSGSNLDADKLDGLHESTFARKDANATIDMNNYNINYVGQLHFQDNVRFYDDGNDNYLNFRWGDTGAGGMRFRDGDYHVNGTVYGSGDQFGLLDQDGSWAVRIQNNSAVDLRVNNSSRLICDSGGTEFRNGGTTVGEVTTAGLARFASDVVAYYSFSDQRLKTDIKPTTNNLDKILKLEPVEYTWKDGGREGKKEIGLVAQDVEKVIPEVVRENERLNDDTLYKQVDYEHLVSTLIGAIQEQQDQIAELKSEVTNLKSTMCKCKNQ